MTDLRRIVQSERARIGAEVGLSDWVTVDQSMIDAFAKVTHDDQFIHVDPVRAAAETPFGTTVAHGFLTLSLASKFQIEAVGLLPGQAMGMNYGFDRIRFVSPVKSGARIRGRFRLLDIVERDAKTLLVKTGLSVEIEGEDKPALVAEWLTLAIFPENGATGEQV